MPSLPAKIGRGRRLALCAALLFSLGLAPIAPAQLAYAKKPEVKKPIEGIATWYKVPENSPTKKRAGKGELTAAHNRFPYGTQLRVTHLGNKKSVVVRITDRGVYKRGTVIDLCKEAAEKLDMIREGSTKVRLEILPDDKAAKAPGW